MTWKVKVRSENQKFRVRRHVCFIVIEESSNECETSRRETGIDDDHNETMIMPPDHDLGRP